MLAVPLPPGLQVLVGRLPLPEVHAPPEPFAVPQVHVIGDLIAFHLRRQRADPIGDPSRRVSLVGDHLMVLLLRVQEVEEDDGVDAAAEEDEDRRAAQLKDRHVEHILMAQERQFDVIVDISDAQKLLPRVWLNEVFVKHLFEVSGSFAGLHPVFEQS